jgi:nucleoside-diphosphate-sugar epimerase
MKNWAITGSTGFVGRSVLQRVVELNATFSTIDAPYEILGISRRLPSQPIPGVRYIDLGDLSSSIDWAPVLQGVDVLVHTSARVHVMTDLATEPLAEFRRVNVDSTLHLARQAAVAGVKRLVFISSIGVNGQYTSSGLAFTESQAVHPHNAYALSKFEAEQGLRQIAAETDLEVVIIRPPLVYGPCAPGNFGSLISAVQRGLPLPLALVRNQRSLVGLGNLVDFIVTCARHPKAANQTFLISDGQDLSTPELIRHLAKAAGVPVRLLPVPVWALQIIARLLGRGGAIQGLCGNLQVDISKARELLCWMPPVSLDEGLRACFLSGNEF